jgi:hypothetical protein
VQPLHFQWTSTFGVAQAPSSATMRPATRYVILRRNISLLRPKTASTVVEGNK